jgi:hypothetical protein
MKKIGATLTLLLFLGLLYALANRQILNSWFPALANAIDAAAGYVPTAEPSLRVTHECRYLDATATQCWSHLRIVSLNDDPITIEKVVVNGRAECTSGRSFQAITLLMASQFINVKDKTLNKGDAYGVGVSCEPVDVEIVTDKGTWSGGSR